MICHDMSKDFLIVEEQRTPYYGGWTLLRHTAVGILLSFLIVAAIRSELRNQQLETRILQLELTDFVEYLETQSKRTQYPDEPKRVRREASPDPQWPQHGQPRSQYDPHQRRTSTYLTRGGDGANLQRNDHEETFFTKASQDGSYVRPTGLKEMYERLPPAQEQQPKMTYSPPPQPSRAPVDLRAGDYRHQPSHFVQPPIQRVGTTSARVVRYGGDVDKEEVIAGHFVADVSNFTSSDNPRLRNSNGIFQIWRPATWMDNRMKQKFEMEASEGVVKVTEGGLYQIYAQIHYHDNQPNSFVVEVNGEPVLQCSTVTGLSSCFTSGMSRLKSWDRVVVKNVGVDRFSIYTPEKSFFGFVKLD